MHPPEDVLDVNPLRLMTKYEIDCYNKDHMFAFHRCKLAPESQLLASKTMYKQMDEQFDSVIRMMRRVRQDSIQESWDEHTDVLHNYYQNQTILENFYICKNKAFLKLLEIFHHFPMDRLFEKKNFKTFHLCECPGFFLDAIYYTWLRMKNEKKIENTWQWGANSLNPYFENIDAIEKLIDDSHMRGHMKNWWFGPMDDGDLLKCDEDYFIKNHLAGSYDLVTADGGIYNELRLHELEEHVNKLILAEIDTGLCLLRTGGVFILKIWRFSEEELRVHMKKLANYFPKITAFKPMASRPGSAEKYLICEGFNEGTCPMDDVMCFNCDMLFVEQQIGRINLHIDLFLDPETMPFNIAHRKEFLAEMRERVFTADFAYYRNELHKMFPSGNRRLTSPWVKMYGHNLARRLCEYTQRQYGSHMERTVNSYLLSYPNKSAFFGLPDINHDEVLDMVHEKSKLLITSKILMRLNIKDTLFLDPEVWQVLCVQPRRRYRDLFHCTSEVFDPPCVLWNKFFSRSGKSYLLKLRIGVTILDVIDALIEGYDSGMRSFEFAFADDSERPLICSRLSASVFILMSFIFVKGPEETGYTKFRFERMRKNDSVRFLLDRLRKEISTVRPGVSIRSFMPLHVFDIFHERILNTNVRFLMTYYNHEPPTQSPENTRCSQEQEEAKEEAGKAMEEDSEATDYSSEEQESGEEHEPESDDDEEREEDDENQ